MATQIGSLVIEMSANVARLQQDMQAARQQVERATGDMASAASRASDMLRTIGAGISVTAVVYAVKEIGLALVDAQGQVDKFRAAMGAVGSMDVGQEFEFVRRAARDLGLDLVETSNGYTKLAAAARGTSLAGDGAREIFMAVAKAATTLGLSSDETSGALMAISQMMSKGTVQAEELRGQLGERLPGAFQIAARAMGVSTAELSKMLETGQVISDDFLPKFARQLERELGEASAQAAQSASRELTRLGNSWTEMVQAIADSGAANAIGKTLKIVGDAFAATAEQIRIAKADGKGFVGQMMAGFNTPWSTAQDRLDSANRTLADPNAGFYARGQAGYEHDRAARELGVLGMSSGYTDESVRLAGRVAASEVAAVGQVSDAYKKLALELSGQHKDFQKNLAILNAEREKGLLDEGTYVEKVQQLIKAQGGVKEAVKSRSDAEKEARDRAKELNETQLEALGISKDYAEKVARLVELWRTGKLTTEEYTDAIRQLGEAQPVVKQHTEALARAEKERFDNLVRARTLEIERVESVREQTEQVRQQAAQEEARTRTLGLTGAALVQVLNAEADLEIARVEGLAALADLDPAEKSLADAYRTQADELRRLKEARASGVERQEEIDRAKAAAAAAKQAEDDWKRASDQINQSLTDALLRGFESGKSFGQNLVDTLKNMFNTLILRPIIQAVISPVTAGITGALGLTGTANAASGGGALSTLGSAASLFGAGGIGGSLMAGAGWLTGATTFSGALGAAGSLIGTGTLSGGLAGLGMAAGALGPIALGAMALMSLLGDGGGPKTGGTYDTIGLSERLYTPNDADATAQQFGQGVLTSINDMAKALGGTGGDLRLAFGFDKDPQGDAQSRLSSVLRDASGNTLFESLARNVGRDEQQFQGEIANEAARLLLEGLQASDLPQQVAEYLAGYDASVLGAADIGKILDAAQALAPQAEKSLLDKALEDPGTYTAVSTEVRELVQIATDAYQVHRDQLAVQQEIRDAAKEQVTLLQAQVRQLGDGLTQVRDRLVEVATTAAELLTVQKAAATAPRMVA